PEPLGEPEGRRLHRRPPPAGLRPRQRRDDGAALRREARDRRVELHRARRRDGGRRRAPLHRVERRPARSAARQGLARRSRRRRGRRGVRGRPRARDPDGCLRGPLARVLPLVARRLGGLSPSRARSRAGGLTPPSNTGRHRGCGSHAEAALSQHPLDDTEPTMSITSPIRPLYEGQTYRNLLFLSAAIPVAALALALFVAGWTSIGVLAITPLVVPLLLGFRGAVGLLARGEAAIARSLLG